MKLIHILFILFIHGVHAILAKEVENDLSLLSPPSSLNLDSNLRKALLKALTELENEEQEKLTQESRTGSAHSLGDTDGRSFERAKASAVSIFANAESEVKSDDAVTTEQEESTTSATTVTNPVVYVQKSDGVHHKSVTTYLKAKQEQPDAFLAAGSSSFFPSSSLPSNHKNEVLQTRSISSAQGTASDGFNFLKSAITSGVKTIPHTVKVAAATSPATPLVTTPENEAKVEDVQFFSAPLVAAFTVHQDARGLPNKVEPIYKTQPAIISSTTQKLLSTVNQPTTEKNLLFEESLQHKQQALEQQLYSFQQQQVKHQEYLLQQQKLLREQEQRIAAEQTRLKHNQQPFVPISQFTSFNTPNQNSFKTTSNTLVSFQPSLSQTQTEQLLQNGLLPQNAQILPVKSASNFLKSPFGSNFNDLQVPTQRNVYQHNTFQTFPNNFVQTLPSLQTTKIFRQDNNNNNNFGSNQFTLNPNPRPVQTITQFSPHPNRVFRSNLESFHTGNFQYQPPFVNQHLNNLLYQSGISRGVRQSEDLGIVSKILSYNVGRDNLFS